MRLAIVGAGQISHRFLKEAQQTRRAEFVATCARTTDSAKARAVEYGIDSWYTDYMAMYDAIAPDGVVIATQPTLHAAPTIAALQRGIHVLCEKPMAATFQDCQSMVAAAERSRATFLCLPYDAQPPFLAALAYLNEATLGAFTGAEAQVLLPGVARERWHDREYVGGGVVLDAMVYSVSTLTSLLGPAHRVTGMVNTLIPHRILGDGAGATLVPPPRDRTQTRSVESNVDDNATVIMEWHGGQQAVVRALWGTSIVRYDVTVYGRQGTLWLAGDDVVVHSPNRVLPNTTAVTWGSYDSCYRVPTPPASVGHHGVIDHFVDCVAKRCQPRCGAQQQLHVHEILFKAYEAAHTGRTQVLMTTFEPWHAIDPAFHDTRSRLL